MNESQNEGRIAVTVLVDDRAGEGLLAEHGFAIWIEAFGKRLLFDCGEGRAIRHNAAALGVDLGSADCIVLSHGHSDHTGGLSAVLDRAVRAEVYCHPAARLPRYAVSGSISREIGMPTVSRASLEKHPDSLIHWIREPVVVADRIGVITAIPRQSGYEDTGGPYFRDPAGREPDPFEDDTAVWLDTGNGLVVICGCAHAGVVNTLEHALEASGASRIRAVIGGFHLLRADRRRLDLTIEALRALDPGLIVPCHCTGEAAAGALAEAFGPRIVACISGGKLVFDGASDST